MDRNALSLQFRSRELTRDEAGYNQWRERLERREWRTEETGLLLCDVWDLHWSRGATERLNAMIPRMNRVVNAARSRGVRIIHAPSDTMEFYEGSPARRRIREIDLAPEPEPLNHVDPPLPIDDSDGGSDTGETSQHWAWSRQHPGIDIDEDRDVLSDDGSAIYSYMQASGIRNLLLMGVHTNMCVLGRSFAIKAMVRRGVPVALLRDLTDTMYNPALRPYVPHDEGTRLVVEFIEAFWCPTILSEELL
jgi:nicotinamidase-related amidase